MAAAAQWSLEKFPDLGIHLDVLAGNLPAIGFYKRLGGTDVEGKIWRPAFGGEVKEKIYYWSDPRVLLT